MFYRYTATIYFSNLQRIKSKSNDLNKLILYIVTILEHHTDYINGIVLDNQTGRVVHQCRRITNLLN